MAEATSLDAILKLIGSFSDQETTQTTSGGTSTTQKQVSQDTINATLKSALESNQGLANMVSGQNQTGMYNSTVNQQLTSDLLARLTANVAADSAPTVTTQTPRTTTTVTPSTGASSLPLIAGIGAGKYALDAMGGTKGVIDWTKKLFDSSDLFGTSTDIGTDAVSSIAESIGNGGMDAAFNYSGDMISSALQDSAGSLWESAVGDIGMTAAENVIGDIGSEVGGEVASSATNTIICTEAARQGLLSKRLFLAELAYLQRHPLAADTQAGYHFLAAPVVKWMKNDPKVAKFFAKWAEDYIYGELFAVPSRHHKFIVTFLLPLCSLLGKLVSKKQITAHSAEV